MTHGTEGKIYCRSSFTWKTPEEFAADEARIEEAAFMRMVGQGQLTAPNVISDTIPDGVKSMSNGRMYDSKSELRKEYKKAGVIEVGNDSSISKEAIMSAWAPHKRPKTTQQRNEILKSIEYDVEKAISRTNLTSYRHEEIK